MVSDRLNVFSHGWDKKRVCSYITNNPLEFIIKSTTYSYFWSIISLNFFSLGGTISPFAFLYPRLFLIVTILNKTTLQLYCSRNFRFSVPVYHRSYKLSGNILKIPISFNLALLIYILLSYFGSRHKFTFLLPRTSLFQIYSSRVLCISASLQLQYQFFPSTFIFISPTNITLPELK